MGRRGQGRAAIIRAAEATFAERGIDGASSREILARAGQRNESAVQYHFGSRDGLIRAALLERLRRIDARRLAMLDAAERDDDDAREASLQRLLEALVVPLAEEVSAEEGRDYIRFAAQAVQRPGFDLAKLARDSELPGLRRTLAGLRHHAKGLRPPARRIRERMILQLVFGTLRSWADNQLGPASQQAVVNEIVAVLTVIVRGPSKNSATTRSTR